MSNQEDLVPAQEIQPEAQQKSIVEEDVAKVGSVEEKIRGALSQMTKSLASASQPRFKDFWEGKKQCLDLFKQASSSRTRSMLWNEFVQVSDEGKRLKNLLDEESSFAAEQIDLAVQMLQKDLETLKPVGIQLAALGGFLYKKKDFYEGLQGELMLLNTLSSRVNELRKELMRTEMRLGAKSKLFDKLSACGDLVFPKRKALIAQVSLSFVEDVQHFVESKGIDLYEQREEVKRLQLLAKELTLNTQAFAKVRQFLSATWERLKEDEKHKKAEFDTKREASRTKSDGIRVKITEFAEKVASGVSSAELASLEQSLQGELRSLDLMKEDARVLKGSLFEAKEPLIQKQNLEKEKIAKARLELENHRIEKNQAFINELSELEKNEDLEALKELEKGLEKLTLNEKERFELCYRIKKAHDRALAACVAKECLSGDEEALETLLEECLEKRESIRDKLEEYRQASGRSGFDFEMAMRYREVLEEEKESLYAISSLIEELEEALAAKA